MMRHHGDIASKDVKGRGPLDAIGCRYVQVVSPSTDQSEDQSKGGETLPVIRRRVTSSNLKGRLVTQL